MPRKRKESSAASAASTSPKRSKRLAEDEKEVEVLSHAGVAPALAEENGPSPARSSGTRSDKGKRQVKDEDGEESRFIGDPVPEDEAQLKWPHRYRQKKKAEKTGSLETSKGMEPVKDLVQARRHYTEALVDGRVHFKLGDDGYVQAEEGEDSYICRIVEMFEGVDGVEYISAQWFYRAKDTIIKSCSDLIDDKRVFLSEIKDDNPLDCLLEKLKIVRVPLDLDRESKRARLADGDYYYDMLYLVPFSTYQNLPPDNQSDGDESDSTISSESDVNGAVNEVSRTHEGKQSEMRMLDLYSGCGAMSTGLCLGANMANVNLVTRWAVDLNSYACQSLKLNHPETEVRNESAEDFLQLLKEWQKLCLSFSLINSGDSQQSLNPVSVEEDAEEEEEDDDDNGGTDEEVFEVDKVLSICYGDPKETNKRGLYLKIRWKGYGPEEDTWEPIEGLSDCQKKIKEFVVNGYNSKILPLPGDVDVICGGPPCQGISGFNRFRKKDKPLDDEKNKQLVVYMDIVEYLKPRFALMENVVDILKFAKGFLGRYALARLVSMNYQARVGLMVAGSYGLPQFRMRMFMWGACPTEKLPQYPLPTHNVVARGANPVEFESNAVVYDEGPKVELEKELYLGDAISDLPSVTNDEARDEMAYVDEPKTEFQQFIRLRKHEMPGYLAVGQEPSDHLLYDHQPLKLNIDDYQRVCQIPKRKGANFRDLKGVRVKADNTVEWDPDVERVYLPSGKPLVPDYAMSFIEGKSSKPFGRLWWDETVPTVVTRAEPHNQTILHPLQDRVLSIRENARLQGFPDYYKLVGPIKERYIQVGNAVAVPVARALGYSLAMSCKGTAGDDPLFTLPAKFPNIQPAVTSPSIDEENQ